MQYVYCSFATGDSGNPAFSKVYFRLQEDIVMTSFACMAGISCCSVDAAASSEEEEEEEQFQMLRLCVTRKKQVLIITITEEKVAIER